MKKTLGKILIGASILAFLDQFTKYLIQKNLSETYYIFGDFFRLEYSENFGVAFGFPIPFFLLVGLNIILIAAIIFFAAKELNLKNPMAKISISLILGGAIGNLIDRFANGFVVDFIGVYKWPNFNLADIFITVGVLLLLVFYAKIKASNLIPHGPRRN